VAIEVMVKVKFRSFNPGPHGALMTKTNMDLTELLQKQDQSDFLRTIAEAFLQLTMEADVEGLIGVPMEVKKVSTISIPNEGH
jgi:hypothetical protein